MGRATRAVIHQNLASALGVIGLLIVTSVFGLVGIDAAIMLHEGSTIAVVLNALRLLTYREQSGAARGTASWTSVAGRRRRLKTSYPGLGGV